MKTIRNPRALGTWGILGLLVSTLAASGCMGPTQAVDDESPTSLRNGHPGSKRLDFPHAYHVFNGTVPGSAIGFSLEVAHQTHLQWQYDIHATWTNSTYWWIYTDLMLQSEGAQLITGKGLSDANWFCPQPSESPASCSPQEKVKKGAAGATIALPPGAYFFYVAALGAASLSIDLHILSNQTTVIGIPFFLDSMLASMQTRGDFDAGDAQVSRIERSMSTTRFGYVHMRTVGESRANEFIVSSMNKSTTRYYPAANNRWQTESGMIVDKPHLGIGGGSWTFSAIVDDNASSILGLVGVIWDPPFLNELGEFVEYGRRG